MTGWYKRIQFGGNSGRPLSGTDLRDSGRWFFLLLNDLFAAPPRYKAGRGGSSCLIHPSLSEDAVRAPALFLRFCFETSSSITRTAKPDAGTRRLYRKRLLQVGARSPSVRMSQVRQHGCPVSGGASPAGDHGAVGCQGTEQPGFPCRLLIRFSEGMLGGFFCSVAPAQDQAQVKITAPGERSRAKVWSGHGVHVPSRWSVGRAVQLTLMRRSWGLGALCVASVCGAIHHSFPSCEVNLQGWGC